MSILYSILKPIIKKAVKGNLHQKSYEEFARISRNLQAKFKFQLPKKKGYEFRDEIIDCHWKANFGEVIPLLEHDFHVACVVL